jgi:hypothetical protein
MKETSHKYLENESREDEDVLYPDYFGLLTVEDWADQHDNSVEIIDL